MKIPCPLSRDAILLFFARQHSRSLSQGRTAESIVSRKDAKGGRKDAKKRTQLRLASGKSSDMHSEVLIFLCILCVFALYFASLRETPPGSLFGPHIMANHLHQAAMLITMRVV
jgi:hypothetical protein